MEYKAKTILLVEDEAIIAVMEKLWLSREGFNVIHCTTGEKAIETVQSESSAIDLILMDIDLGSGIDGTQAALQILKTHDIPLLFLSSHTEKEIVKKTEEITSYGYVVKGSTETVLLASIKMAFKLYKANKSLKNNEETLKEREFWLNESQKVSGIGTFVYDFLLDQWLGSKMLDEIFGIDENYVKDLNGWRNLIHPEDRDLIMVQFRNTIKDRSQFNIKYRIINSENGNIAQVHSTGKMIFGISGEPVKMIGTTQDITESCKLEENLAQNNKNAQFLSQLAFRLAGLPAEADIAGFLLKEIKGFTGAELVAYSDYDPLRQALLLSRVEAEQETLEKIGNLAGETIFKTASPVSNETYNRILRETVGFRTSFSEVSFGAIPEFVSKAIKELTGIDYFYGISYVVAGELFGTSALAFKAGQKAPSGELLESFAHLAAIALRRKKIEDALLHSEKKFRSIVELSSTAMHFYNLEDDDRLILTGSNPAAERITGIEHKNLIGMTIEEAFPALIATFIPGIYRKVAKGELENQSFETPYHNNHISLFYHVHVFQIKYGYIVVNFFDITGRKKAEEALKESERNYKQLVDNMGEGIAILDHNETFLFANRAGETIFGVEPGKLAGRNLLEFVDPDDHDLIKSQTLLRQKGEQSVYEHMLRVENGKKRSILVTATPRYDNNGTHVGNFGIFRDITERKEAELLLRKNALELKELNATKDKLFSIIAHDLRGPFSGFIGLTETLSTNLDVLTKQEIAGYAKAMYSTSKRVFDLLNNLLEWSSLQTGRIEIIPSRLNLFYAVENIKSLFSSAASLKSISIINEVSPETFAFADEKILSTILRNLISNAIKFTERGKYIIISACCESDFIEVSVIDSGIGMDHTVLQKIFGIDSGFKTKGTDGEEGTGLGLVLCKELVERSGGKIRVTSVLTKGTIFTFTLPA